MREGDVVLASLSQADHNLKIRPVIFFREMPFYRDLLVCGISTQLHRQIKGFDELIAPKRHWRLLRTLSSFLSDTN